MYPLFRSNFRIKQKKSFLKILNISAFVSKFYQSQETTIDPYSSSEIIYTKKIITLPCERFLSFPSETGWHVFPGEPPYVNQVSYPRPLCYPPLLFARACVLVWTRVCVGVGRTADM